MKRKVTNVLALALAACVGILDMSVVVAESSAQQLTGEAVLETVSAGESFAELSVSDGDSSVEDASGLIYAESTQEYSEWKESLVVETPRTFSLRATVNNDLLSNEYLELWAGGGYFTLGTKEGDPGLTTDNNKIMIFGHPNSSTSYTTINVAGTNYKYGASNGVFDAEKQAYISSNVYDGIEITQELKIVKNKGTERDDVLQIKYTARNTTDEVIEVGTRIMIDTMLGSNDAAPFKIPGYGSVTTEKEFVGDDIPVFWQAFDSLTNPGVISQGRFLTDGYEAPDKVQFTNWGRVYGTSWEYQIRSGSSNGDSAVSAIWNLSDLDPSESREYVTYYGLSELEGNLLPPLALAISADSVMTYDGENMPKQDVIGYVQNISGANAENVVVSIEVPAGLKLENGSERVVIGDMPNNAEKQVDWKLALDTESPKDSYTIKVTVSADGCADKVVSKTIKVDAVQKAIIIIPGIAGTRLYSDEEVKTEDYLLDEFDEKKHHFTFETGYQFWEPYTSKQVNKVSAITNKQNKIQSEAMMMRCDNEGNSMIDIVPETEGQGGTYGAQNTYTKLVEQIKDTYSDECDVRFWGYDWRQDISDIALDLEAFIEEEGYSDVVLVCHSMGGLVASKYLANGSDNQEKVEKLVTIGTPYLGAPKALYVFETGHLLDWASSTFCMATPIKAVANNFTSVYELLPTENYFDLNSTTYVQYQNNNGFWKKKTTSKYDYDQTKGLISNRSWASGKGFLNVAESFAETLFVDGEHITNTVDSYYIIGYNRDTILEVEEEYNKDGSFDSCRELTIANGGDETVPVISANIGGTADEDKTYYIQETHTGLVKNDDVIELVENIIDGESGQYASSISKTCPEEINEKGWFGRNKTIRIQLKIECPVDLAMIDEDGTEWAYVSPEFIYNECNEDGTFYFLGKDNDAKMAYLQDDNYNVKLIGTDAGEMKYTMSVFDAGYEISRIVFEDVVITDTTVIYTNTDRFGEIVLNVDENDDGVVDYQVYPSYTMDDEAILNEESGIDLNKVSAIAANSDLSMRINAGSIKFENAVFTEGKLDFYSNNEVVMNSNDNNIASLFKNAQQLESEYAVTYEEIREDIEILFADEQDVLPSRAVNHGDRDAIYYIPEQLTDFVTDNNIMICTQDLRTVDDCIIYSKNGDISLYTSNVYYDGIIYAPNGTVTINANNIIISGTIIADRILINGQNVVFE